MHRLKTSILALFLIFQTCLAFSAELTDAQLRFFLEKDLPSWVTLQSLQSKSFINKETGSGRISVLASLLLKEPIFRPATEAETEAAYSKFALSQADIQNNLPIRAKTKHLLINKRNETISVPIELLCNETVSGWSCKDDFSIFKLPGAPRDPADKYFMSLNSKEGESILQAAHDEKLRISKLETVYINTLKEYFTVGSARSGTFYKEPISFTGTEPLEVIRRTDGDATIRVHGKIIWKAGAPKSPSGIDGITAAQGQPCHFEGSIRINRETSEPDQVLFRLYWKNQNKVVESGFSALLKKYEFQTVYQDLIFENIRPVENASKADVKEQSAPALLQNSLKDPKTAPTKDLNDAPKEDRSEKIFVSSDVNIKSEAPQKKIVDAEKSYWTTVASKILLAKRKADLSAFEQDLRTQLQVTVTRDGRLTEIKILQSSKNEPFDKLAEALIQQASPFPIFPAELTRDAAELQFLISAKR